MLLNTLQQLLNVYGPTGREDKVADLIEKMLEGKVDSCRRDAMGNLIVEKKGKENGKNIMFSAHMDHIGLIVTDIEDEGYLRVTNVGGVSIGMSKTRHVVFANGTEGVVVCQPTKGETETMAHLFVDIGAADKAEAWGCLRVCAGLLHAGRTPHCCPCHGRPLRLRIAGTASDGRGEAGKHHHRCFLHPGRGWPSWCQCGGLCCAA